MCGSCTLLVFSLGFYNSIRNTQNMYFDRFAKYDLVADFNPIPLAVHHPAAEYMQENQKALILPVTIRNENYTLAVTEDSFDMVHIPAEALQHGVIIPQYLGLTLYTSFDYVNGITDEIPEVYNTLYGRSKDMTALITYLKDNNIDLATIDDDKTSFTTIMESMSVLIWLMRLFCPIGFYSPILSGVD